MGEWKELKICEVGDVVGGGTPSTEVVEYWNGDIPWLTPRDLSNYTKRTIGRGERSISEKGLQNSNARILPKGTVLLSSRAPIGYLAIAENQISTNQGFQSIIPNQETTTEFLYYLLKNNVEYLKSQGEGTTFGELSKRTLRELVFSFPELNEQRTIASILSSLDDKIDILHRQNKTLEALAETLFRQWFVEEDQNNNTEKLGNVVQTASGGTPSRNNPSYFVNGIYKWVKSKELQGTFIFETEEKITEDALKNSASKILPANSILIALYGATVGEYAILAEQATCNQAVCAIIPNDHYPYSYLFNLIKSNKENLINLAVGSAQQNISQILIKDLSVSSDKDLIQAFHTSVKSVYEKIKSNICQIRTLAQLRDTLLPKLMSGEVRVKY